MNFMIEIANGDKSIWKRKERHTLSCDNVNRNCVKSLKLKKCFFFFIIILLSVLFLCCSTTTWVKKNRRMGENLFSSFVVQSETVENERNKKKKKNRTNRDEEEKKNDDVSKKRTLTEYKRIYDSWYRLKSVIYIFYFIFSALLSPFSVVVNVWV